MATRKRGTGYLADFMVAGTRYRETFSTEGEAQAWEHRARAAIIAGQPLPPVSNARTETGSGLHTLGALFDHVETTHWRSNPRVSDPETAVRQGRFVVEFFGRNTAVKSITTEDMKRLIKSVTDEGFSYATADRRLAALSKLLGVAVEKGVINRKPTIPFSRETGERIRFLSHEEARTLLDLWLAWDQPELHAFTIFGLHTGARLQALLDVRWSDFTTGYTKVIFRTQDKGSSIRTLPMSKLTIGAIEVMRQRHPDSRGPFTHFKKDGHLRTMWDRMQAHLGWDDVVIHTLRHTCATWMLDRTGNLKKVQTWLGHKRIETTLKYAKLVTGALDDMADATDLALATPERREIA
jgi:integrase